MQNAKFKKCRMHAKADEQSGLALLPFAFCILNFEF
jgi:hypothetical protein